MTPSKRPVFFIDWCLGKTVADALEAANVKIKHHKAIGKNILELRAIAKANVKVFTLSSGNLTRQDMADLFVKTISKLEKFSQGNKPPFIAKIYKIGTVKLWKNRTDLLKFLKEK